MHGRLFLMSGICDVLVSFLYLQNAATIALIAARAV
jgi:hypothetical protein